MSRFAAGAAAIVALVSVVGVYGAGHRAGRQACEAAYVAQREAGRRATARLLERAAEVTGEIDAAHQAEAERIRIVYRTLTREIPHALTPETDRAYPLPHGLVRLHDAAALGVPAVPDPAGVPDDAASPVAPSDLAGAVVDNYGACRLDAARLTALQAWVREQQAVR